MEVIAFVVILGCVAAEIRDSVMMNKLTKVKPVGGHLSHKFLALTEIPPPRAPHDPSGRRHMEDGDCTHRPGGVDVVEGAKINIFGEDYQDGIAKTVATIVYPDHIDHKHFEVTSQVPYLTLGVINAIGYHPTTEQGDHPPECEKIYQDHLDNQYSDENTDYSEESLEMARMPLFSNLPSLSAEARLGQMYDDLDM